MDEHGNNRTGDVNELISLIQEGSSGIFVKLSEIYSPLIKKEVNRYAGSLGTADLEDLRQGALVSLYRAALSYSSEKGVTFGLYAKICIVNGIADTLRYVGKKQPCLNFEQVSDDDLPRSADDANPQRFVLNKERVIDMHREIRRTLSELEYNIFQLYILGYSYAEIAARLGRSEKSVDNALCRIKVKLKKCLKQSAFADDMPE